MFVRGSCGIVLFAGVISPLGAQSKYELPVLGESAASVSQSTVKSPVGLSQRLASRVTLRAQDSTVISLIEAVARKANLRVNYAEATDALKRRVSVNLENVTALYAFNAILKGSGLEVKPLSDDVTVVVRPVKKSGERSDTVESAGKVSGKIVDSVTKKGIADVTVSINQHKITVMSKADGSFVLNNVPAGEYSVSARKFGYRSNVQRVKVVAGISTTAEFTLGAAATELNEVVTTVTGQQRKLEIGNDITTINVPDVMKQAPITSVTDLLEARVPGLTVMRTSGVPGAPSRIRLRGIGGGLMSGTSGAPTNDPIVIVDGIRVYAGQSGVDDQTGYRRGDGETNRSASYYPTPSPLDQIDPNSIEKIEVLRGPSAAALYGSDAGDGVIVITTKKGTPGTSRWDVSASKGIEMMAGGYAAPGFYRFGHLPTGGGNVNGPPSPYCPALYAGGTLYSDCKVDSLVRFQALDIPRLSTIGRGTSDNITATASGGSRELTYSITGSIRRQLGLTKMPALYQDLYKTLYDSAPSRRMRRPNSMDSKSGQASFSGNFSQDLMATFTTSLSKSVQYQSSANEQLASMASSYIDTLNINPGRPGLYAYQAASENTTVNHALSLNYSRLRWLPLTTTFGVNRVERKAEGLAPRGILSLYESIVPGMGNVVETAVNSKGEFTENHQNTTVGTARITGTLLPQSRLPISFGSEITQQASSSIAGVSDTLVPGISRPSTLKDANRSGRNSTTGGWFVEPRLNLNSKFFVNPGFRFDGSGVSGSRGGFNGGLWSLFPKLNFSWIAIDREGSDPLWGAISMIRPRFAFGVAGVQPAAEWSLRTLEQDMGGWNPLNSVDSLAPDFGLRIRTVGNTRLSPEKTREIEGGFDMQLWDTRITLSATGFYKMRRDAIERLQLASSVGLDGSVNETDVVSGGVTHRQFNSYYANIGHVKNTGFELSLNANIIDRPDIGWNIDLSVSKYNNKLTQLFGDKSVIDFGDGTRLVEGYPLFGRWSRPITGWSEPANGKKLWYGDYSVGDSLVYMGMQTPDFEMPFRTSLSLLRGLLSINGQFNYKAGLTQNNLGGGTLLGNIYENPNSTRSQQAYALAASCYIVTESQRLSTKNKPCTDYGFIQKVNSLRFNSMSIAYNVPRTQLNRLPFSSLSFAIQGSNLGLWTNYRGKDPDVNGNMIGDITEDSGQLPMPRTWSLQIRIGT